jgi:hypothetical protein
MPKVTHYKRGGITAIRNDMLQNPMLSLKAKGLLCLMLSFPDGWEYKRDHIISLSSDGRTVWENTIDELIVRGYVSRCRVNAGRGRFTYNYLISDAPIPMNDAERFAKTGHL